MSISLDPTTGIVAPALDLTTPLAVADGGTGSSSSNAIAMVKIASYTASNSATIDFTSIGNTVYDSYILICARVVPQTNATSLRLRVSQDGVWKSGASEYTYNHSRFTSAGSGLDGSTGDTSLALSGSAELLGNTVPQHSFSGDFNLSNALQTSTDMHITGKYSMYAASNTRIVGIMGGALTANLARDGFRLFMSSGNISSGTFTLYGLK